MRGKVVVLAGVGLLLATVAGAGEREELKAVGEGRALYLTHCATCHGKDARGASSPDLGTIGERDGSFQVLHVVNHIVGRRDGFAGGTMPSWGRVLVRQWPGGRGPAALQAWKLAKYLEFVQAPVTTGRVADAPDRVQP